MAEVAAGAVGAAAGAANAAGCRARDYPYGIAKKIAMPTGAADVQPNLGRAVALSLYLQQLYRHAAVITKPLFLKLLLGRSCPWHTYTQALGLVKPRCV